MLIQYSIGPLRKGSGRPMPPGVLLDKNAGSEDQPLEKFTIAPGRRVEGLLGNLVDLEVKFKIPENCNLRQQPIRRQAAHGFERLPVTPEAFFDIAPTGIVRQSIQPLRSGRLEGL